MITQENVNLIAKTLFKFGFVDWQQRRDGILTKAYTDYPEEILDSLSLIVEQLQEVDSNLDAAFFPNGVNKDGLHIVYAHIFLKRKPLVLKRNDQRGYYEFESY